MRKILIISSVGCIVLLLLGYSGYRGYKVWKQNRWLSMAREYAAKPDPRNELLCLKQVLSINPQNLEASRRMAILCEADRNPNAMTWRERVVSLAPGSVEDRLAQVQTAMVFRDFNVATNALEAVNAQAKKSFAYLNLAGVIFTALGNTPAAEKYFSEASRVEPQNPVPLLNLSVLRLNSSNALDKAAARIELQRISLNATNNSLRIQAKRELLGDALRGKENAAAMTLVTDLAKQPDAPFSDKLLRLDIMQLVKNPEYNITLAEYQHEAATNNAKLSDMTKWLALRSKPETALQWLQTLPANTRTNQTAQLLQAECLMQAKNWTMVHSLLSKQDWSDLDFLRHAFLARAMREQNMDAGSTAEWAVALRMANDYKTRTIFLFQLAAQWNWANEAEQMLWTIVNRYPEENWSYDVLSQALIMGGRTRPLMQLLTIQTKRKPDDLNVKNNLAMAAMLLGAQELKPFDIAQTLHDKAPQNPDFSSTYALSLYLQKKYADALKIMEQLPGKTLNSGAIAGYYGLILKATGSTAKARVCLEQALKSHLMPEEKKMFEQALN